MSLTVYLQEADEYRAMESSLIIRCRGMQAKNDSLMITTTGYFSGNGGMSDQQGGISTSPLFCHSNTTNERIPRRIWAIRRNSYNLSSFSNFPTSFTKGQSLVFLQGFMWRLGGGDPQRKAKKICHNQKPYFHALPRPVGVKVSCRHSTMSLPTPPTCLSSLGIIPLVSCMCCNAHCKCTLHIALQTLLPQHNRKNPKNKSD
jgi:hypothetical protein